MFIFKVCEALEKAKVSYAIVGGYAVALHGAPRGTFDLDLALTWTLTNLEKAEKVMHELGLVSLLPITSSNLFQYRDEYIKNKHLITWNFYNPVNPAQQVDLLVNYDLKQAHVDLIKMKEGNKIRVLSIGDLIAMKKASGRPQDLEDVKALEAL